MFHAAHPGGTLTWKEGAKLMLMPKELKYKNSQRKNKRNQRAPGPKRKQLQRKQNVVGMWWGCGGV